MFGFPGGHSRKSSRVVAHATQQDVCSQRLVRLVVDAAVVDPVTDSAAAAPPASPLVSPARPRLSRVFRLLHVASVIVLTTLLVLGLVGHLVRDRTVWLAAMMYIPILPLGVLSILLALLPRLTLRA